MTLNPTKVIQSVTDKNEETQYTNWVRRNVFWEPEQVFSYRLFFPRITEEKVFRYNITDSVLQV